MSTTHTSNNGHVTVRLHQDSSQQRNEKQRNEEQIAWLVALFTGMQRKGWTGVVKIHMHAGGVRGARKEESVDLDWR